MKRRRSGWKLLILLLLVFGLWYWLEDMGLIGGWPNLKMGKISALPEDNPEEILAKRNQFQGLARNSSGETAAKANQESKRLQDTLEAWSEDYALNLELKVNEHVAAGQKEQARMLLDKIPPAYMQTRQAALFEKLREKIGE